MTKPIIPVARRHASDTNYTSGPDIGTATKVDPGAALAAQGWLPGAPVPAQHLNHLLASAAAVARRMLAVLALRPHTTDAAFADSTAACAAACVENGGASEGIKALVVKAGTAGSMYVNDSDAVTVAGDTVSVTSLVTSIAYDNTAGRFIAVGSGGNNHCSSTDNGANWVTGGAIGFVPQDIVRNPTLGLFIVNSASGSGSARTTNGAAWTSSSHTLAASGKGGIAVLSSGRTVICGFDGFDAPRFTISDNGSTWADSGGFPADGGISFLNEGYICGNGGPLIWHVGLRGSPPSAIRVSVSSDGVTWTTRADLSISVDNIPPAALQPDTQPRIMCCQNTGMLVIVCAEVATSRIFAIASLDGGFTWTEPVYYAGASLRAFAVANGKLYRTLGSGLEQSVGVGWR
ncbi:MAG: hypothetical protein V4593_08375 [Pseudomonadota bacterium]